MKQPKLLIQEKREHTATHEPHHVPPVRKLPRWKLKGCPNCGGDLYLDGQEYTCLHCGRKQW
ncbi:hypothetical protein ES703_16738 [subsurface metagenome]